MTEVELVEKGLAAWYCKLVMGLKLQCSGIRYMPVHHIAAISDALLEYDSQHQRCSLSACALQGDKACASEHAELMDIPNLSRLIQPTYLSFGDTETFSAGKAEKKTRHWTHTHLSGSRMSGEGQQAIKMHCTRSMRASDPAFESLS